MYRTAAAEANQTVTENSVGYLLCCYVADNEAKAQEEAKHLSHEAIMRSVELFGKAVMPASRDA